MWQRESTQGTRDLQTICVVREENGGSKEAKGETARGRMVESWRWGLVIRRVDLGNNRGGRQNAMDNQKRVLKYGQEGKRAKERSGPRHHGVGEQGNGQGCTPGSKGGEMKAVEVREGEDSEVGAWCKVPWAMA